MPIPMQKIWKSEMKLPACAEAASCSSPYWDSITVSIRFTPTVINDCAEMGTAIFSTFL